LPPACFAQADKIEDYSAACYAALGITQADVETAFGGNNRACRYGTKLTTRHNGVALDPVNPDPGLNLVAGKKNFLTKCDTPAWLPSDGPSQCYDMTYITPLSFSAHASVQGALLCRHKAHDPALDAGGTPTDEDFDDVAMILYDKTSGNTCWFQTTDGSSAKIDGNHVPVPHLVAPPQPGVPAAADFWLKPSQTGGVNCAQCHDNGPWMNSQWLYSQFNQLTDDGPGKYVTVAYPGFNTWPKTDDFVEIGRAGLEGTDASLTQAEKDAQRRLPECTSCHKIAPSTFNGTAWPGTGGLLGSTNNGTYSRWFAFTTGRAPIPQSTATEHATPLPGDYAFTHWMPPSSRRPADAATYDKVYRKHLEILKTCMETLRADRTAPCATTKLALLNTTPTGTGALVSATNVQTGQTYTATAAPLDTSADPPPPQTLAAGQSLRLGWQADATFPVCTVRATMPAGVFVSATSASGTAQIGSGANWQLPESPPVIGPLTEPGIYDFSIYCRDTYTASLQFQVGTTGPRSVVQLATSVNGAVAATAIHSNGLLRPATTTNVQSTDTVGLSWIAYNVQPSSCLLSGPGVASTDEAGSQTIPSATADQTFTFQCTGANDGVLRSVSSTIHPVSSSGCAYSIAPAAASPPASGGSGSVTVTATTGCAWAVSGNPGWITITSGANGSGNGTVAYSVQANTGGSRTATLTIAGQPFAVTQAGQACAYAIAPAAASPPASGGSGSVTVTATPGCAWAVSGNPAWITINSGANGSGNGTVAYSVQANTGGSRAATLTIAGQPFTVTQAGQPTAPLSATLSAPDIPVVRPDPVSVLGNLTITISGGTAGQRITANVAVYLNTILAVTSDTALLTDASGATISAVKAANAYTFRNVQFEQPGASGTRVYTIRNMKANTALMLLAISSAQVIAAVTITGAVPLPLANPFQAVALVRRNVAPTADSVIPGSGKGASQVFRLSYSDANGYLDLASVFVLFRSNDRQQKECRVDYDRAKNALYLRSESGPTLGPITPGSAATLRNSRCELSAAGSSMSGSGNTLTLNIALTFRPSFSGQTTILMEASDGSLTSGLQARGTWVVP
jgi:hypothetical protein